MTDITYDGHPLKAAPAADDYIPIWDVSGNAPKKALRSALVGAVLTGGGTIATNGKTLTVPESGIVPLVTLPQTWTARQAFAAGVGLQGTKTGVAHNVATPLCDIISGGSSALAANYLVAITVASGSTVSAQTLLVTQGFSQVAAAKLGESLFGHSSITVAAAANTGQRKATLTITQVNGAAQACTVSVSVLPLMAHADPEITLTML